jgi:peroxiredoxin Q/BCP
MRPAAGDLAPDFTLAAHDGSSVTLSGLLASSGAHVLLWFYPQADTPG